jgi:hypothetical protein
MILLFLISLPSRLWSSCAELRWSFYRSVSEERFRGEIMAGVEWVAVMSAAVLARHLRWLLMRTTWRLIVLGSRGWLGFGFAEVARRMQGPSIDGVNWSRG